MCVCAAVRLSRLLPLTSLICTILAVVAVRCRVSSEAVLEATRWLALCRPAWASWGSCGKPAGWLRSPAGCEVGDG